jgi:hypothetical protein
MNNKFSFYKAPVRNVVPALQMSIREAFGYIISDVARERTLRLRMMTDVAERRAYKGSAFDHVTFSGEFARRVTSGLIVHSGYICLDIDHIESETELQRIKALLINDNSVVVARLVFRSPSGDGLKVVYELPEGMKQALWDAEADSERIGQLHKHFYEMISRYLNGKYGIVTDHTSDVARTCFLCHDADAYFDESVQIADSRDTACRVRLMQDIKEHVDLPLRGIGHGVPCPYIERSDWDTVEALVRGIEQACVDITGDYHQWMRIGFALASAFGESGRGFYHRVSRFYSGYSNVECNRQYDRCLRARGGGVGLGTFIYLAKTA